MAVFDDIAVREADTRWEEEPEETTWEEAGRRLAGVMGPAFL